MLAIIKITARELFFRLEYMAMLSIGAVFILLFGSFYLNDTLAEQVLALTSMSSPGNPALSRDILVSTMFLVGEFFITIIVLVTMPQIVARDDQQKTLSLFLSKPIPRWKYFFGKYFGCVAALSVSICVLALLILMFVLIQSPSLNSAVIRSTVFLILKLSILSALIMSLSLRFTEWVGAIIALMYYIGGHVSVLFPEWGSAYPGAWATMMTATYHVLPDLTPVSSWSILSAEVEQYPLNINYYYWFFKQIGLYTFGFLFLGYDSFRKKSL